MVKISGTDLTAGEGAGSRITGRAGERLNAAASGTGTIPAKTAVPPPAPEFRIIPKNLLSLAHALGLPQDRLSASIVSFARFFSLPLDPGLLAKIRREALSPAGEKFASGDKALSPKNREGAAALAAAAAAGKGVVLSREGLEAYAGFLSGQDAAGPEHPAEYAGPGDQPLGGEGGNSGGGGSPNKGGGGERRERPGEERPAVPVLKAGDVVNAERLREEILKTGDRHPLLNLLNRLPGKDGQRWMVFPFSVAGKTGEFRAVLRILLHESPSGRCPDRLALDISGGDLNNPAFRWLFIYNRQPGESPWMTVHIWPPEREKTLSAFQKELSDLLALPPEHIRLCNDGEFPQFAADCQDGVLRSINKEV